MRFASVVVRLLRRAGNSFVEQIGAAEASTRAIALVRIGIPVVIWSEWADQLILFRHLNPTAVLVSSCIFASTILLFIGFWSRVSALLAGASVTSAIYFLGHGAGRDFVHHHTHMMMLATWLLAVTPCGGSYSLDRYLAVGSARRVLRPLPVERGPLWGQRLLGVLVSSVYLWSVYSKLTPAFMSGARMEQIFMTFYGSSAYPEWAGFHSAMLALAWITLLTEVFLAVGLWVPRTRRLAIAVGIVFHAALYYTLPVSTFSALMLLLYLTFPDPDAVHRVIEDLSGHEPAPSG